MSSIKRTAPLSGSCFVWFMGFYCTDENNIFMWLRTTQSNGVLPLCNVVWVAKLSLPLLAAISSCPSKEKPPRTIFVDAAVSNMLIYLYTYIYWRGLIFRYLIRIQSSCFAVRLLTFSVKNFTRPSCRHLLSLAISKCKAAFIRDH